MTPADAMEERLLRIKAVSDMVGFSASMVYRLIAQGKFPQQRCIEGCAVWRLSDVQAWITDQWEKARAS